MPAIRTTRRLLHAYGDESEPCWEGGQDTAQSCLDIEERLAWGVHLFRGLMALEARAQAHALRETTKEVEQLLEIIPLFYQIWIGVSERYLVRAEDFVQTGLAVEGLDEFRETLDEAHCLLGNLELGDEILPIEELLKRAKPNNPHPGRYGE